MIHAIREALRNAMEADAKNRTAKRLPPRTAKRLSLDAELSTSAVRDLLGTVEDPRIGTLAALAAALEIPVGALLDDTVPIVGSVGDDGFVSLLPEGEELGRAYRPPTRDPNVVAIQVLGDSLKPLYRAGDLIFISRAHDGVRDDDIDAEVVAKLLGSNEAYLRVLKGGKPGKHSLRGFNTRDRDDVILHWAAPVLFVARAGTSVPKP